MYKGGWAQLRHAVDQLEAIDYCPHELSDITYLIRGNVPKALWTHVDQLLSGDIFYQNEPRVSVWAGHCPDLPRLVSNGMLVEYHGVGMDFTGFTSEEDDGSPHVDAGRAGSEKRCIIQ